MADIQSSLQRLQESIRGLSDASALVGALGVDVDVNQDIFQEEQAGVGTSVSPPQQPAVSSPTKYHRLPHDGGVSVIGGVATEPDGRSSLGSSGGPSSHDEEQQSMLSSIPRELRDSAEVRCVNPIRVSHALAGPIVGGTTGVVDVVIDTSLPACRAAHSTSLHMLCETPALICGGTQKIQNLNPAGVVSHRSTCVTAAVDSTPAVVLQLQYIAQTCTPPARRPCITSISLLTDLFPFTGSSRLVSKRHDKNTKTLCRLPSVSIARTNGVGDCRSNACPAIFRNAKPGTFGAWHTSCVPRPNNIKMRAARELEDLRLEKESLQVMKQQLAAVHKLRIDLQRKDSVIQARKALRQLILLAAVTGGISYVIVCL